MPPLDIPDQIERYRIRRPLGEGGFGAVYLATDLMTGQGVALKLSVRESATFRFRQEFLILSMLDHPNLPTAYRLGQSGETVWLAEEHVVGLPPELYVSLGKRSGDALARTLQVLLSMCDGLAALHRAGVVHCDLKSANVLVEPGGRTRIIDLGGAKVLEGGDPIGRGRVGTWSHSAPEQLRSGRLSPLSDVYSVGVMGYRLLTGRPPYPGHTREELRAAMEAPLVGPIAGAPPALSELVMAMLSQAPGSRPDVDAIRAALLGCGAAAPAPLPAMGRHHASRQVGRLMLSMARPGSMLRIGGEEREVLLGGLQADARAMGAAVLGSSCSGGRGLGGLGKVAQEASLLLSDEVPGVSRARLQAMDMDSDTSALAPGAEHAVIATLLALAAAQAVVVVLSGVHRASPAGDRLLAALRRWSRKKQLPLIILASTEDAPDLTAEAPPSGTGDASEAISCGAALCGAGRLSEATRVLWEALLQEPAPPDRARLWLLMARVHLWLQQPGAARLALQRAGDAAGQRPIRARLALVSGQDGSALRLLEGCDTVWARVHRTFALRYRRDPLLTVALAEVAGPGQVLLRLLLHQAVFDHAAAAGEAARALEALQAARRLTRQVHDQLSEADQLAWQIYCEAAGLA